MTRRELREHIFRLLFRVEFHPMEEMKEQEALYIEHLVEPTDEDLVYIQKKMSGVLENLADLDARIDAVATGWKINRMGKVDLTIIRLALFEMVYDEDVPIGVAINEAVELAKRYGTDESASFVNGVLAKLA